MKRLKFIIILMLAFSFTGCIREYSYTDDESSAIAEYMAGRLLEEDKKYDQALLLSEEIISEETFSKGTIELPIVPNESEVVSNHEVEGASNSESHIQVSNNLSSVLGGENFDINYKTYVLAGVYPKEGQNPYFSLTARDGYQLLVVSFDVINKTNQKIEFNLSDIDVEYQLDANVGTIYKPQFTLLENDLRYIDVMVDAKKSIEALLVFEVSKQMDTTGMKLTVTKDKSTSTIEIK